MFKNFMDKFSKEKPIPLPEINRLTIGRAAIIDDLAIKLLPPESLMEFQSNTYPIIAQGKADMGEGVHLHRFYPDDDSVLIQILGGDGITTDFIQEITLFSVFECYYPSAVSDWKDWGNKIRQTTFEMPRGGPVFNRAWFDNSSKPEDPVSLWETVYDARDDETGSRIFQTCMLYSRQIGDMEEFLLINMEEPETGDRCISLMVGMPLSPNQIST